MSHASYDTFDRRQRSDRHRDRDRDRDRDYHRDRPAYREEEYVEARSGPRSSRQTALVRRREDSVEEVERDFPPGDGVYVQRRTTTRRARSDGRGHDRRGMDPARLPRNRTDTLQMLDTGATHPALVRRVHHETVAANHSVNRHSRH